VTRTDKLNAIASEIGECRLCRRWGEGLCVPGEGNPDAPVVLVGEAPGREEAKTGRPFVGRSGKFLRAVMKDAGIDERDVYISSPVKYLPRRATPSKENVLHGATHLLRQLSVIDPALVVLMGNTACIALLGRKVSVTAEHGRVISREGRSYLITFHPAYAMRFPEGKKAFIEDFRKLKRLIRKSKNCHER
jgi:uracil-DNA glycosylase family 4